MAPMPNQIESQPKLHRVLVDGHEIYSSNVLLEALQQYNQARETYRTCNIEFKSVCTYHGGNG